MFYIELTNLKRNLPTGVKWEYKMDGNQVVGTIQPTSNTQPQAVNGGVDLAEITKLAEEKAQAKAEAIVKSMLDQKGIEKTEADAILETWRNSQKQKQAEMETSLNDYKTKYETLSAQLQNDKKLAIVKSELIASGANQKLLDLLLKSIDLSKLEVDTDGKAKNIESLIKPIKENYKDFFGEVKNIGVQPKNIPNTNEFADDPFLAGFMKNKK